MLAVYYAYTNTQGNIMTLDQIKQAIADGKRVYWASRAYSVILDTCDQYLIHCTINDSYIGLTWLDGVTLNGKEEEFFSI